MNQASAFLAALAKCPLVAILRGITPSEVDAIGDALVDAGITLIEVPLNSPAPIESISRLSRRLSGTAMIGAGTVLVAEQVDAVAKAGGQLIVSPNTDPVVIARTAAAGLVSLPGCFTPSDAFAAIGAGAHALKFFPAEGLGPAAVKAMGAVLPRDLPRLAVGGITADTIGPWLEAGVSGFGIGTALYAPGRTVRQVADAARTFALAARNARESNNV